MFSVGVSILGLHRAPEVKLPAESHDVLQRSLMASYLLGQSFLRRLSWWKIDNVNNAMEFEFTGAF